MSLDKFEVSHPCLYPVEVKGLCHRNVPVNDPPQTFRHLVYQREDRPLFDVRTLKIVRRNFDHIIRLICEDTGVNFSTVMAAKILGAYLGSGEQGECWPPAPEFFIPWLISPEWRNYSLFGQYVTNNAELKNAICKCVPGAFVDKNGRVGARDGCHVGINFHFIHTDLEQKHDGSWFITTKFSVHCSHEDEDVDKSSTIYEKIITADPERFKRLITAPPEQAKRDQALLELADQLFLKYRLDV